MALRTYRRDTVEYILIEYIRVFLKLLVYPPTELKVIQHFPCEQVQLGFKYKFRRGFLPTPI